MDKNLKQDHHYILCWNDTSGIEEIIHIRPLKAGRKHVKFISAFEKNSLK